MYLIDVYLGNKELEPNHRAFGPPNRADDLFLRFLLGEVHRSEFDILMNHYIEEAERRK